MKKFYLGLFKKLTILILLTQFFFPLAAQAAWTTDYQGGDRNAVVPSFDDPSLELKSTQTASLDSFELPVYDSGIFYFSETQ